MKVFSKIIVSVLMAASVAVPLTVFAVDGDPVSSCAGARDGTPCQATQGILGVVAVGVCVQQQCKGTAAKGAGGSMESILGQIGGQILGQLMQKLMSGGAGGSGGGSGGASYSQASYTPTVPTCSSGFYYDPTTLACTQIPSTINVATDSSTSTGKATSILDDLFGNTSVTNTNTSNTKAATATTIVDLAASTTSSTTTGTMSSTTVRKTTRHLVTDSLGNSYYVDDATNDASSTQLIVNVQENENTQVVGFYGSNSNTFSNGQSTTVIGRLCQNRPWATGFVATFIPPRFFDNLCAQRGYSVGAPVIQKVTAPINTTRAENKVIQSQATTSALQMKEGLLCTPNVVDKGKPVTLQYSCGTSTLKQAVGFQPGVSGRAYTFSAQKSSTYGITCADNFSAQCSVTVVSPLVTIWAQSNSVSLGSRATIFWSAKDVSSCNVTGPSFAEKGLKGGASTVPIYDASMFTIACVSPSGATTTKSVTVNIAN